MMFNGTHRLGVVRGRVVLAAVVVAAAGWVMPAAAAAGSLPVLAWSPTTSAGTFDFGSVSVGSAQSQTFSLKNSGGSATSALKIALPGAGGSAAFSKIADTCTAASLGPGKSCSVTVSYAPTGAGESDAATLAASSSKPTASASLGLTGHGPVPYTVCATGCPYTNLQDAINAVENATIQNPIAVGPGDYTNANNFVVTGTVVIQGAGDGSDASTHTILDGQNYGSVIFDNGSNANLTISGVEITKGASGGDGGGINNSGGTLTLDGNVTITGNTAHDAGGGIANDGTLTFATGSNVSITSNTTGGLGGGIFNGYSTFSTVTFATGSNVLITSNTATNGGGISNYGTVTFATGSNASITGNTPDDCYETSCPA